MDHTFDNNNSDNDYMLQTHIQKKILDIIINNNFIFYGSKYMSSHSIELSLVSWRWFTWVSEWMNDTIDNKWLKKRIIDNVSIEEKLASKYCLFKAINQWTPDIKELNILSIDDKLIKKALELLKISIDNNDNNNSTGDINKDNIIKTNNSIFKSHHFSKERIQFYNKYTPHGFKKITYSESSGNIAPRRFQIEPPSKIEEFNCIMELSKSSLTTFQIVHQYIPQTVVTPLSNCINLTNLTISIPQDEKTVRTYLECIELLSNQLSSLTTYSPHYFHDVHKYGDEQFKQNQLAYITKTLLTILSYDGLKKNIESLNIEYIPSPSLQDLLLQYQSLNSLVFIGSFLVDISQIYNLSPFLLSSKVQKFQIPLDHTIKANSPTTDQLELLDKKLKFNDNVKRVSINLKNYSDRLLNTIFSPFPTSITSLHIDSLFSVTKTPLMLDCFQPLVNSLRTLRFQTHYSSLGNILKFINQCTKIEKVELVFQKWNDSCIHFQ